uniref:DRBM domain-containing protein n=1 Tax=Anabas testudineus TaxID=64144 RepID=A0A7N6BJG7_ANATE
AFFSDEANMLSSLISPIRHWGAGESSKNALVQLNELRPGLQYEIMSKTGPLPLQWSRTNKESFIQFPNASQAHSIMGNFASTAMDFTADKLDISDTFLQEFEPSLHENFNLLRYNKTKEEVFCSYYKHRRLVRLTLDLVSSTNPKRRTLSTSFTEHLSPVALLNKLRPGLRYMCLTERVHGRPRRSFIMVVRVEGRVFEGCGHSKRLAKAQAAAAALQSLYNISLGPERKVIGPSEQQNHLPQVSRSTVCCFTSTINTVYGQKSSQCATHQHDHHVLRPQSWMVSCTLARSI